MTASALITVTLLAAITLALGWPLGFQSVTSYLAFWLLCGLVVATSVRLARALFGAAGTVDIIVRSSVVAFALIVTASLTLGTTGIVGTVPYAIVLGACYAAARLFTHLDRGSTVALRIPLIVAAIGVPILAFVLAVGFIESPLTLYDSVSYHLVFPARWLQDHLSSSCRRRSATKRRRTRPPTASCSFSG